MKAGKNDSESPPKLTESVSSDEKSTQRDKKNDDWIAEMEREMQEIAKKWPGARQ